jgi:hypothetical protein
MNLFIWSSARKTNFLFIAFLLTGLAVGITHQPASATLTNNIILDVGDAIFSDFTVPTAVEDRPQE